MNSKKLFPIFLAIPLVIAGCSKSSSKKKTSSKQEESSSITSEVSPTSESSPTSEGSPSSSGTPGPTSSVVPVSSETPAPSSSVVPGSSAEPVSSSSVIPASSGSEAPSSSGGVVPPEPGTDQQYLDEFNSLKSSILNNHNYTVNVHSYIEGYESEEGGSFDDQIIMINNQCLAGNGQYTSLGHKTGYIKQGTQGYVYFDYYDSLGDSIITNGFYSTNGSVGITDLFDVNAENLFLGEYLQSSNVFTTSNEDVIAVAYNMSGYGAYLLSAPEAVTFTVDKDNHTLTMNADFDYIFFDEVEVHAKIKVALNIVHISNTHHTAMEAYLASPTDSYPNRNAWSDDDIALFNERNDGVIPAFPSGASSYSVTVDEFDDDYEHEPTSHFHKIVYNNYDSGDLVTSYYNQYVNENFLEGTPVRPNSRLFERDIPDYEHMTHSYAKLEMGYIEPSVRFPNGIFWIIFNGYTEATNIDTVGKFNQYIAARSYSTYVPQFNLDPSIAITKFEDKTDEWNASSHDYEFVTSATMMRIAISDYATASAFVTAYGSDLAPYKFTTVNHMGSPLYQVTYTNTEDFKTDSVVTLTDVPAMTAETYPGYVQVRFLVYALKGEEDLPKLSSIELGGTFKTDFIVGDTFSIGSGSVTAWYSNGTCSTHVEGECSFSGYNMSQSGNQTVTVSYTEGGITKYAYYDIHIMSLVNYTASFSYAGSCTVVINLCDDGTGTYSLTRSSPSGTWTQYFTYVISGDTITFTLTKEYSTSDFTRLSLFPGESIGTKRVCSYDSENDTMRVRLSDSSDTESTARYVDLVRA